MVRGYEKAWAALLGGGTASAITTLVLAGSSALSKGAIPGPTPELIVGAISGLVSAVFGAAAAYLATNTTDATPKIEDALTSSVAKRVRKVTEAPAP